MENQMRTPIQYTGIIDTRFSDLDPYGHVNAKNYLDYVATSRLVFLKRETNYPVEKIIKEGYAFYLKSSTTNYKTPIIGLTPVLVSSFVSSLAQSTLKVQFNIATPDGTRTFSDGELIYVVVGIGTGRPVAVPTWMEDLFFSPSL